MFEILILESIFGMYTCQPSVTYAIVKHLPQELSGHLVLVALSLNFMPGFVVNLGGIGRRSGWIRVDQPWMDIQTRGSDPQGLPGRSKVLNATEITAMLHAVDVINRGCHFNVCSLIINAIAQP